MSKMFRAWLDDLSNRSGYTYNYLSKIYELLVKQDGYVNEVFFEHATLNRLWAKEKALS